MADNGKAPVLAIDGPSGSGKGTVAVRVAETLGWHLLDSGSLYRIVGYSAMQREVSLEDPVAAVTLASSLTIRFEGSEIYVDDANVTNLIRTEEVGAAASKAAAIQGVRDVLFDAQRALRRPPGLVADGRDMGTVVFPDAVLKIFLDATAQERARRRYNQLKNKGLSVSLRALLATIEERDERDRRRAASPLKPAPDATRIDSTNLTIDEVVQSVLVKLENLGFGMDSK